MSKETTISTNNECYNGKSSISKPDSYNTIPPGKKEAEE